MDIQDLMCCGNCLRQDNNQNGVTTCIRKKFPTNEVVASYYCDYWKFDKLDASDRRNIEIPEYK